MTIREENANAALEVMSRFAVNPKWLIYLPPTMSPSETTTRPGMLEHPAEAFVYFRNRRRADAWSARRSTWAPAPSSSSAGTKRPRVKRFGVIDEGIGMVVTRTGRPLLQRPMR